MGSLILAAIAAFGGIFLNKVAGGRPYRAYRRDILVFAIVVAILTIVIQLCLPKIR